MSEFKPHIPAESQSFLFFVASIVASILIVSFFLYENKSKRNIIFEFILALSAAASLGVSIFFALVRADVVL